MSSHVPWYRSIMLRVSAVIAVILFIPLIAFWNYFNDISQAHGLQQYEEAMHNTLYAASLIMQNTMSQVSDFSRQVSQDPQLILLVTDYQNNAQNAEIRKTLRSQLSLALNQYVSQLPDLESVYLYFPGVKTTITMLPNQKEFSADDPYGNLLHQFYYNDLRAAIQWNILPTPDGADKVLSLSRPVEAGNGCMLICNLKNSAWEPELSDLGLDRVDLLITDYAGNVLLSGEKKGYNTNIAGCWAPAFSSSADWGSYPYQEGDQSVQVTFYNARESGWKYLARTPQKDVSAQLSISPAFYFTAVLCYAVATALGSALLYQWVIRPIQTLQASMRLVEGGRLETVEPAARRDELGVLFQCYNHMILRLRQLIDQVYIQQLLHKQMQLSFLQSQMDEHFLFNTLNTIYAESCREQADSSAQMILILSKYFRLSLSYGQEKLPLDQISQLLRLYLNLQKMRFGSALRCKIEEFPEMADYVALKYLFQPIVENAVVHGLEKNFEDHDLQIRFRRQGETLYFEVQDDGAGISPERLEQLCRQINGAQEKSQESFALKNIREQMCLTYGERDIHIESQLGQGTRVWFVIPLERKEDSDA